MSSSYRRRAAELREEEYQRRVDKDAARKAYERVQGARDDEREVPALRKLVAKQMLLVMVLDAQRRHLRDGVRLGLIRKAS